MSKPLDPENLVVETFVPGEESTIEAAYCTGCMSTCGILPP
jgi:hypothetical protein